MSLENIYKKASLVMKPAAMKEGKLYSQQPHSGDGDFTFTRANGAQTRINKHGLIESVADNTPRLSYELDDNGNVSECPHLLLEPTRTNQFTYSEDLSNIDFKNALGVITDDIISPNGSLTADKALQSTGDYFRETVSVTDGTTYSFSVFLKKGDLRYAVLRSLFSINGTTPANSNCVFDLDNKSVLYTGTDVVSASIEEYTNDWYRCSFVSIASTTNSADFIDFYFTSSSSSTQSSGTEGFGYAWGMQFEEGSYPTSYIPTEGSAVQRKVDFCFINSGLQGVLNTSEGTLFVDVEVPRVSSIGSFERIVLSDQNASTDRIFIDNYGGNWRALMLSTAGNVNKTIVGVTANQRIKVAIAYSSTQLRVSYDGNAATTTSGSYTPSTTLESFKFSDKDGGNKWQGKIYQTMIFNEALSDAELIELTS